MSTHNIKGEIDVHRLPTDSEEYEWNNWKFKYTKSHILHSLCTSPEKCKTDDKCLLCSYNDRLELPHLPEMVFPKNILTVVHPSGGLIEFNAFDALKQVNNGNMPIQVACSEAWKETRYVLQTLDLEVVPPPWAAMFILNEPIKLFRNPDNLAEKIKAFDWTFSTDYRGTLSSDALVELTNERIDMELLKQKEKILFYHEMMLYEDELHDNGISSMTIKIRVMPSSFFILQRFFLRVDGVLVRINDTRVFHNFTKDCIIREYTNKECNINDLKLPLTVFGDPNLLSSHMPVRSEIIEKITFLPKKE